MPSLVACAMTACKFNRDGQCDKSEIFIDDGVSCASFEPEVDPMMALMGGGADPRAALLEMMAGGGGPPMGGGLPPPDMGMGGPPVGAPPMGGPPVGGPPLGGVLPPPAQI